MTSTARKPAAYDLHLHTCWSYDATNEPESCFERAGQLGLRCVAFTEHNNMDSWPEVLRAAEKHSGIRVITAAELTVNTSMGSVDLLCYNLPASPEGALAEVLGEYRSWMAHHAAIRLQGAQSLGWKYDAADQKALLRGYRPARVLEAQGVTIERNANLSDLMIQRGFIASRAEYNKAQEAVMGIHPRPPASRVVPAVQDAGGLVVIAHPARVYFRGQDSARMEALREECRLDGIECAHPHIPPELTSVYREYCRRHGLVSTAGSDAHDMIHLGTPPDGWGHSGQSCFACHLGEDSWLDEFLERIPARL